ncbi:hypothetical protein AB6A40_002258 [Gnathostoma spinigerum]|uniref:Zinc finger Ran-binding domain-containing protein 2 n=1 Tax=Gnathostoma spinigerum TaxID=75299 RepID=A0ABD6EBM7_9BILA
MNGDEASKYLERQRRNAGNVVTAAPQRRALKDGEWACIDAKCAFINSDRHQVCDRCGKGMKGSSAKPRSKHRVGREIGKDAAEKSKGLFAAEDWSCTKCGNVNWARRTACNVCNAPKLGDLEVRTGYGGGYMDRQNVEYIERKDDDEFDEFGRKKKRRKLEEDQNQEESKADANAEQTSFPRSEEDKHEKERVDSERSSHTEEEEEEEGDDDDLDKYDLTADEFEVEDLKAKIAARKAEIAAAAGTTGTSPSRADSRCSSECSCSCSGGECSCEESDPEERRGSGRDRDKNRDRDRERERERDRDRKDERRLEHRRDSRERSPRRHHSGHRDRDRH